MRPAKLSVPEARILGVIPEAKPGELPSKVQRVRAAHKAAAAKKKKHDKRRKER